jgi:RNA polymerase sigma-70 factor (ECF subfamily)
LVRRKRPEGVEDIAEHPDPADDQAAVLQRDSAARLVVAALVALPERQRAAVALTHYQGLSNIESAEVMGISVEALESLLSRARRGLRDRLMPLRDDLIGDL